MKSTRVFLCLILTLPIAVFSQEPADRVIAEALKPSPLETNLRHLTDQIGGRVPGTPAMQKAVEWGVAAFKAAGADSVHTEDFTIPVSWAEGNTQMSVSVPESFGVRVVSLAWAPALAPQHHVAVVDVGSGTVEDFAKAGNFSGTILLVHSSEMATWDDLFAEYLRAPGIIDRAVQGNALAIAFQSTRPHDLLYRHTNSQAGEIDRLPMVLVAREDAARMARLIASGQKLYADLAIPNRIGGPITTANMVAELKGSESPDEFVVLGAHLDSWDLGTGALDNGCNSALVIDAARTIHASGTIPRRSIRFILFTGEEEGLLGSAAYAHDHRAELDRMIAAVVFDSGMGKVTGYSVGGRKDTVAAVRDALEPVARLGVKDFTTDVSMDTDNFDFLIEGVPTLVANQEPANYMLNYHAASDTFDKVDITELKRHVAIAAITAFALADNPGRIGARQSRAELEQMFHETGLDQQMKDAGFWKYWQSSERGRQP
jgi:carboxypeptidase Q